MAKATAEAAELTRQKIIDTALSITLEEGFEHATLGNLARRIGMSRSGINAHFQYKKDIANAIVPMLSQILLAPLNFDSAQAFFDSWCLAVDNDPEFRAVMKALGPIIPVHIGSQGLVQRINGDPDEALDITYKAIGYASVKVSEIDSASVTPTEK